MDRRLSVALDRYLTQSDLDARHVSCYDWDEDTGKTRVLHEWQVVYNERTGKAIYFCENCEKEVEL